jgi:hypothetical protein
VPRPAHGVSELSFEFQFCEITFGVYSSKMKFPFSPFFFSISPPQKNPKHDIFGHSGARKMLVSENPCGVWQWDFWAFLVIFPKFYLFD